MAEELDQEVHYCGPGDLSPQDYLQVGVEGGKRLLVVGEAPAPNGWRLSGRAFYTQQGRLLPTGVRLNRLLAQIGCQIENAGFTELVKCFIGSKRSLLRICGPRTWSLFVEQIEMTDPSLIIVLGKATHETFQRCYGQKVEFGAPVTIRISGTPRNVLFIYHPSPISPTSEARNMEIFSTYRASLSRMLQGPIRQ